jgi:hypothetical protein
MSWRRLSRPTGWVVLVGVCCGYPAAAEFDVTLDAMPQELTVRNDWPEDTPTVYLVGLPDREADPVRITRGLSLNGVRLTEGLLSESVLILYPDGTGKWGYHAGFDIFREPDIRNGKRIDPRTLVEYDKWRYDPLQPVSAVGGDMTLLRLFDRKPFPPLRYEIAFPPPIVVRCLRISSNCDQIASPGVEVTASLYADRECTEVIARQKVGGEHGRFPIVFDDLATDRLFVELAATAAGDTPVYLYWTFLEADLDTRGLQLPVLQSGGNTIRVTDDTDSSHRARVVLRWFEKPTADRIWDDFEGDLGWSGCQPAEGSSETGLAFTGGSFARTSFPAVGKDHMLHRPLRPPLDLTEHNHVAIASRVRQGAPMVAIQLGIQNDGGRYQYMRLRPGSHWTFQSFDISGFARDKVTALNVYFTAVRGYDHPEMTCEYDIDTLCLYHEEPQAPQKRELPAHVAQYQSPYAAAASAMAPAPPIQQWFPMGVYDGILGRPEAEAVYLLDQMKKLNMNTVYVSNGTPQGLERILPLAEARGIRLIYQGTSDGALYFLHHPTKEARLDSLNRQLLPSAQEWIPKFADRPGVIAWSLTEEITPEMSRELGPYYKLVRGLAPKQPPSVLHNNLEAAVADLETNGPLVITHDCYPLFWSPRSGPSNPRRSLAFYRGRVSSYYKACREHGASLWMMPQSWGCEPSAPLDPPNYGYRTGMRTPEPGEIKLQGWVAIAEGATGLMYYAAVASRPTDHQLWSHDWQETPNAQAAGEFFAEVAKVAPLLCRLERDYGEEGFVEVTSGNATAHSFVKREGYPGSARYIVLASLNGFEPQTVALEITGGAGVFDLLTREEVTGKLSAINLGPGEGRVYLVGSRQDFEADGQMIDSW